MMFRFPISTHKPTAHESENRRPRASFAPDSTTSSNEQVVSARNQQCIRPRKIFSMSRKQTVDNELILSPMRAPESSPVKKAENKSKAAATHRGTVTKVLQEQLPNDKPESRNDEESTAYEVFEFFRGGEEEAQGNKNKVVTEQPPNLRLCNSSTTDMGEIGRYSLADSTMTTPRHEDDNGNNNQTLVAIFALPSELTAKESSSTIFFTQSELDASPIPSPGHPPACSTSSSTNTPVPLHRVRAGLEDNSLKMLKTEAKKKQKKVDWRKDVGIVATTKTTTMTKTTSTDDDAATLKASNKLQHEASCVGAGMVKYQMDIIQEDMEMLQQDLQNTMLELLPSCRHGADE